MAKLNYLMLGSLDGYIADEHGNFDWAAPDDEVHAFVNDLMRPVGTYLYGRRMYEVMAVWETIGTGEEQPPAIQDFAEMWRSAAKIVYSRSLGAPETAATRIERDFEAEAVRRLKESSERDLAVGGSHLAAQAIAAGLVDDFHLFLAPYVAGGGNPMFPDGVRVALDLREERRFSAGTVYLRYAVAG